MAGTLLLLSIGVAQWWVLRERVQRAWRWIAVTLRPGSWVSDLYMVIARPLWQEGQPRWLTAAIGVVAGLLMVACVAVVTGAGLVRILGQQATDTHTGHAGKATETNSVVS